MANSYFRFKQFTVNQHLCAMKVGIDGVLLGARTDTGNCKNILDIGTGTGLIALMLAQRCSAKIMAIDIDPGAIRQANENISSSPWPDRIETREISLQDYSEQTNDKFDLIVSNPPYFINALKSPDPSRSTARHTYRLTHTELLLYSKKLLAEKGKICIILPVNEGFDCINYAKTIDLFCSKLVEVYPKPDKPVKRLIMEFITDRVETENSKIVIETTERHRYSEDFSLLLKDFYLHL